MRRAVIQKYLYMLFRNTVTDFIKNLPVHLLKLYMNILIFLCAVDFFVAPINLTLRTNNSMFLFRFMISVVVGCVTANAFSRSFWLISSSSFLSIFFLHFLFFFVYNIPEENKILTKSLPAFTAIVHHINCWQINWRQNNFIIWNLKRAWIQL